MQSGMSLDQITQLAICNGLQTMTFRPNKDPLKQALLRNDVIDHSHSDQIVFSQDSCDHHHDTQKT